MASIVPIPLEYANVNRISGHETVEVYRAERVGEPVALRLVRFPDGKGPIFDLVQVITRIGQIALDLKLVTVPRLVHVERVDGGLAIAEAWAGDTGYFAGDKRPLAVIARDLSPVLGDLLTLRRAGKWHGGIRPSRFVAGPKGVSLVALPWAAYLTGMVRDLGTKLEPSAPLRAPELDKTGPRAAEPKATGSNPVARAGGLGTFLLRSAVVDQDSGRSDRPRI